MLLLQKNKKMIPKIIHYCWFGRNPLPPLAQNCIESWKKYLPDYEIKEWNEDNFDINITQYTKEAYEAKKYAFVSDYARFWILYNYGGIYFDTDVEVIAPLSDIIQKGAFMGIESDEETTVNPGLGIGAFPHMEFYKEILEKYQSLSFINHDNTLNLKTIVEYTTETLNLYGLSSTTDVQHINDIFIYPSEYFCPISIKDGKLRKTSNTKTIHHFAQSWQSPIRIYGRKIILFIGGEKLKRFIKRMFLS